jgi:hypothetical protein
MLLLLVLSLFIVGVACECAYTIKAGDSIYSLSGRLGERKLYRDFSIQSHVIYIGCGNGAASNYDVISKSQH